jgi:hypothetical protein
MSKSDDKKELRASLYFSRRKDKDILSALHFEGVEKGDINWIIKELMRDGIKYRKGVYPSNRGVAPITCSEPTPVIPTTVPDSATLPVITYSKEFGEDEDLFEGIELKQRELDEQDVSDKLDNL